MNLAGDIAALPTFSVAQLRKRYAQIFGETTNAGHKAWLVKRIAWRMQANAEGDLSERARRHAALLANDADLRLSPPKPGIPGPDTAAAAVELGHNPRFSIEEGLRRTLEWYRQAL